MMRQVWVRRRSEFVGEVTFIVQGCRYWVTGVSQVKKVHMKGHCRGYAVRGSQVKHHSRSLAEGGVTQLVPGRRSLEGRNLDGQEELAIG